MNEKDTTDIWGHAALEQNRAWLMPYVVSMTGDLRASQDIVQMAFKTAWEKRADYDGTYPLGAWLRGIAKNLIRRHWQTASRTPVFVDIEEIEHLDGAVSRAEHTLMDPGAQESRLRSLQSCLGKLAAKARDLIRLRYYERLHSDDIADRMGMNVSAVDKTISRARQDLRTCMRQAEKQDTLYGY